MAIQRVVLQNIKTHKKTDIPLSRLTVLVGPNSVGKTSVLSAIAFMAYRRGQHYTRSSTSMKSWLRKGETACSIRLVFDTENNIFGETSLRTDNPLPYRIEWRTQYKPGAIEDDTVYGLYGSKLAPFEEILEAHVGNAILLELKTSPMTKPSRMELGKTTTSLGADGSGLAGTLGILRITEPTLYDTIIHHLQTVVPSVRGLRLAKARFEETEFDEHYEELIKVEVDGLKVHIDFENAPDIPAEEVSEGTLLALGLLTAAYSTKDQRILLIDDLEHALHPQAQRQLVEHLRKMLELDSKLQIVATSHSPYLVDAFHPSEVIVFGLRKDGSTAAKCLSEHPDIESAMKVLSTGEFLSSAGEEWLYE